MSPSDPLKIGELIIDPPFMLAPMAGFTKSPFRAVCLRLGCGLAFTELVTAEGLRRRAPRTMHYLETIPEETPVAAHIYGSSPASMAEAARVAESLGRFALIDINCGCPVHRITRRGEGAALMKDPEKIGEIVAAVSKAVSLPVTVKTRTGLSPDLMNISEIARAVEEGGGKALLIHGRLASNLHNGPADWDTIARIKAEVSIPVIGNGGIATAEEALKAMKEYGVDGVMIGRAALGNPWIFEESLARWTERPFTPPTNRERFEVIAGHLRHLHRFMLAEARIRKRPLSKTEAAVCRHFYGHLVHYLSGHPGLGILRKSIAQIKSIEELLEKTAQLLSPLND